MKKTLALLLAVTLLTAYGCTPGSVINDPENDPSSQNSPSDSNSDDDDGSDGSDIDDPTEDPTDDPTDDADDLLANSTFDKSVEVVYGASSATVTVSDNSILYSVNGAHVSIDALTNSVSGVEIKLSGSTSDGGLKIYGNKKLKLTLNGVSLSSSSGAAINNQCKKRTFVYIAPQTVNTLCDASTYTDTPTGEDCKGTIFSESQLIFSGDGSLRVTSNSKHGIASDQYVRILEGNIEVTSAAKDGIHTNDYVRIDGGTLNVTASSDGIECEQGYIYVAGGTTTIKSVDDGLVASYSGTDTTVQPDIHISGGTLVINTSAQKGMAVKAEGTIKVSGGNITAKTTGIASKCLKATGNVAISAGTLNITTTGGGMYESGDTSASACIASDGTVTISGTASVTASSSGAGGKGIKCDTFTQEAGSVSVTTTGAQYRYSSSLTSSPKGIRATSAININGGTLTVSVTGQSEGSEGIESKNSLTFNGGETSVTAYDDAINAAKSIVIAGGKIYAFATNNDGIDSNGTITVTGGLAVSSGKTSPEEGFDCDQNTFKITGGTLLGIGGGSSSPTSSVSTQASIVTSGFTATQNQYLNIRTADGTQLCSFMLPRTLSSCVMLFTSPDLTTGNTYYIYTGGTVSNASTDVWHGYYPSATYSGGSQRTTATASLGGQSGGGGGFGPGKH